MIASLWVVLVFTILNVAASNMPLPWTRELSYSSDAAVMSGDDVSITQYLLLRDNAVSQALLVDGNYNAATASAVSSFQAAHSLPTTGTIDPTSAQLLLDLHSSDGVKDGDWTAASKGYKYKLHIPVHTNRSIETKATLFDAQNNIMHTFTVRAHGHRDNDEGTLPWPDSGSTPPDFGLTQFAGNGDTTTGIIEVDLNSAEPNATLYGPWPVNRFVRGLEGNAKFLLPYLRDGQLLHTGNWSTAQVTWDPTMDMPNSSGCLHAHPEDVEKIYKILSTQLGVVVNANPFSGKEYPYKPQGIAVVELMA